MNALQAYKKIETAAKIVAWGQLFNNLLGLISFFISIYLIWWKWHLGIIGGVFVFFVGIWATNSIFLPALFGILCKPFDEMAKSGAVRLAVLHVINEDTVKKLADTNVTYWPRIIISSMTDEELIQKFGPDLIKENSNIK